MGYLKFVASVEPIGTKKAPRRLFLKMPLAGVVAFGVPLIKLTRASNLVGPADHFVPVGDPAWRSTGGKNNREHLYRNANRFEDDA